MLYTADRAITPVPLPQPAESPSSQPVPGCRFAKRRAVCLSDAADAGVLVGSDKAAVNRTQGGASSEPAWFERLIPPPEQDMTASVAPDPVISQTLEHPALSLDFYYAQLAQRIRQEAQQQEYTCEPLLVTLENMRRLTGHILADCQFPQPLTLEERTAFIKLRGHIEELIRLKAPYKRTVQLVFVMCVLQEMMVARHIAGPLRQSQSALFFRGRFNDTSFFYQGAGGERREYPARVMPLQQAFAHRFGDLLLDGCKEGPEGLLSDCSQADTLLRLLEDPRLLLYPSFAPLDPENFCRFGHVPVYPLGMMTAHALNADGSMKTPLKFLAHDLLHTSINKTWQFLGGAHPLEAIGCRLGFRQLVLDGLPDVLKEQQLERALVLVLFFLFHEESVDRSRHIMEKGSALLLLEQICKVRREHRFDYPPAYRNISDCQAWLACLWVYRVYHACRACPDGVLAAVPEALVTDFSRRVLPALLAHEAFLNKHSASLHDWFLSRSFELSYSKGSPEFLYPDEESHVPGYTGKRVLLQRELDPDAEGIERNTDLAYFLTLLSDPACTLMEQRLGDKLPERAVARALFNSFPGAVD